MSREAEIRIVVQLDEQKIAQKIEWTATDTPFDGLRPCDAVSVSMWDPEDRSTLSFELWTNHLTVDEMNFFLLERLLKMADICRRATQDPETAKLLEDFSSQFEDQLEKSAREKGKNDA